MAETFELTPEQWTRLMERLGNNYGAFDDLVAHSAGGRTFSQTYIVNGQDEAEVLSRGMRAVSTNGQGALANVEVRYAQGATSPSSFSVTTSDPEIIREARAMEAQSAVSRAFHKMAEALRQLMRPPQERMRDLADVLTSAQENLGRSERGTDGLMSRMMPDSRGTQSHEGSHSQGMGGRDRILSDVGSALQGTPFSVPSGLSLSLLERQARNIDPGIVRDFGPSTAVPMPQIGGPSTGFMRYMEPDGTSSVYSGERRLYTDIPVFERNAFGGNDRAVGTLRIYGDLARPERHEIITDNPALRSASERAGIPVRPATMPQPQERERARPPA